MNRAMWARDGFTLIETLVALAVLATSLAVVTGTLASAASRQLETANWSRRLDAGRAQAINTGEAMVVWPDSAHTTPSVLFLPDGRVLGLEPRGSFNRTDIQP